MRRVVLAAVALAALGATMGFVPQFGASRRSLGDLATVAIPRKARLDEVYLFAERATWVSFRASRVHAWAMGSGTPYRANLYVAIHARGATSSSYDEALAAAERELNGGGEGWKLLQRDAQWEVGAGRYTVNMLDEPTWRLKYRDPARRVSVLYQVYQKDWSLEDAKGAVVKMAASVQLLREPDFAEIADRPRREREGRDAAVDGAMRWLAARGFAPLAPHVPVTKDGVTVEYMAEPERRVMLYKAIAGEPARPLPAHVSYGWRVVADTGWEYHMPNGDYYPMEGITRMLDRALPKPGPHYFLIRTIRLDAQDAESYHLEDFFRGVASMR